MTDDHGPRPRFPHAEAGVWGHNGEPGVRLRIGRTSMFIARKHIPAVVNDLERIARELGELDGTGYGRRSLAQWRNLARTRGLVIRALEHELAAATQTIPADQPGNQEGTA